MVTHWCCWAQPHFCAGRYWIWPGCGRHSVLKMDETELCFLFMKHSNELALWDWIRQVSQCNFRRLRFSVYAAIITTNNSLTWGAFCFQAGFRKLLWVSYLGSVFQVIQCYFVCFNCAIQSSCPQASVVKDQSVVHKTGRQWLKDTQALFCASNWQRLVLVWLSWHWGRLTSCVNDYVNEESQLCSTRALVGWSTCRGIMS